MSATVEGRPAEVVVVDDRAGLTSAWLTTVVQAAGHDAVVTELGVEPVGVGLMGANYRLTATFDGEPGAFPTSLIAKLPTPDPAERATVAQGYVAELTFYREVAATVTVRAPRCHLAIDEDRGAAFTLLLEDLAPATPGDQITGCTVAAATAAARNLAGLHAPRWCDPALRTTDWYAPVDEQTAAFLGSLVEGAIGAFAERFAGDWSAADRVLLQAGAEAIPAFMFGRQDRFGVTHGDYRLDNLLFGPGSDDVAAVDWQTLAVGLPARDLAYLLGTSLPVEDRRAAEAEIVRVHHELLVASGVRGYEVADAWDDYRYGMLQCVLINVLGAAFGRRTDRGEAMFTAMANRWIVALRDLDVIDLVTAT